MSEKRAALMKRLAAAQASGVGNNFRDGKYRLAVKKMGLIDGFKGTRFQVTFMVMNAVRFPYVISAKTKAKIEPTPEPNPIGSNVDWMCVRLDDPKSPGPGNIRRFIMDLFNKSTLSDDDYFDTLSEMCDLDVNGDPLKEPLELAKGMVIDMETIRIETAEKKVEIIVPKWGYVAQTSDEQTQVVEWMKQVDVAQAAAAQQQAQLAAGQQATA